MNVRYRVELSQAVPGELTALLNGSPTQLIGEVRLPIPAEPGQLERYDCEYKRNGTANLFIFLDVHRSLAQGQSHRQPDCGRLRHLHAGAHRRSLPQGRADPGCLGQSIDALGRRALPKRRVLRRPEFHFVPMHASWLNMVEIEMGVLRSQRLDRRTATQQQLKSESAVWERQRNAAKARIK